MRKRLFAVIVLVMAVTFAACGDSGKDNKKETESKTQAEAEDIGDDEIKEENASDDNEKTEYADFEGKTMEELAGQGYYLNGYSGIGNKYTFDITNDDDAYDITLDDSCVEIMQNKEFGIPMEELMKMLSKCVVEKCYESDSSMDMQLNVPDKNSEEYPELVGKTVGELVEDGYHINGYMGWGTEWVFYLEGNDGKYMIVLDSPADEIMENREFGSNEDELLKDCIVKECYINED